MMSPPTSIDTSTKPTTKPSTPTPTHPKTHLFTCTFCWHPSTHPPQIIGLSARLACEACYTALINLSICWMCGEIVFRGDECVSLGWCFWHRACYGCLLCGSGMVVRGTRVEELFSDRGEEEGDGGDGGEGVRAREVDEIPLCAQCYVEVEGVGDDSRTVVGKALRRMEYFDGGLSRRRWQARQGNLTGKELPSQVVTRRGGGDGTSCEPVQTRQSIISCRAPLDSTIYVSIFDPINQPAFKPSPTKPIPTWMQPGYSKMPNDYGQRLHPVLDEQLPPPLSVTLPERSHTPPSTPSSRQATRENLTPRPISTPPYPETVAVPRNMRFSRAGFISTEPLKRPSSRLGRFRDTSSYDGIKTPLPYMTPPEYSTSLSEGIWDYFTDRESQSKKSLESVPESHPNPTSPIPPPAPAKAPNRGSPFFAARVASSRSRSPAFIKARAAYEKPGTLTPPPMSSEYLDRYRPVGPSSRQESSNTLTSAPMVKRKSQSAPTQTPKKAGPIIAQISRARPSVDMTNIPAIAAAADRPGSPEPVNVGTLLQGLHVIHGGQVAEKRTGLQADIKRLFGR